MNWSDSAFLIPVSQMGKVVEKLCKHHLFGHTDVKLHNRDIQNS